MRSQLVVVHYPDNLPYSKKPQFLFVRQLDDVFTLTNFDIQKYIEEFLSHNFSVEPDWELYYYLTGVNDANTPFYFGVVSDQLKSPYVDGDVTRRFSDTASEVGSPTPDLMDSMNSLTYKDDDEPDDVLDKMMAQHTRDNDVGKGSNEDV